MAKHREHEHEHGKHVRVTTAPKGWLILALSGDEQAMPPGQAIRWAEALVPETAPDVAAGRDAYPDALPVGNTVDGQPVTLRAITGAHEDDDDEDDEHAPVVNPL